MSSFTVKPWPETLPYNAQCYEVPETRKPGQTSHYRNGIIREFPVSGADPTQPVTTIYDCFEVTHKAHPDYKCLGYRPVLSGNVEDPPTLEFAREYIWQTYAEVAQRRLNIGSAIQALFDEGVAGGGQLPTVGTWTINRPEWELIDMALNAYSKVGVALYSTLGKDAVEYIINHSEITIVFVAARNMETMLNLAPKCSNLRVIVSIDILNQSSEERVREELKKYDIRFLTLEELEASGKSKPLPPQLPSPDTIATICYSSGTTSNPKGVVLTHWNLTSSAIAFSQGFTFASQEPNLALISYLPLAHIVGRIVEYTAFLLGLKIGYYSGDPLKLIEDCQILKPSIFPAVPRILNRIAMRMQAVKAEASLKGLVFRLALGTKVARVQRDGYAHHWFWDLLLFNKLKAVLGGKVEYICSGAAPVVPDVLYMLRASFGCEVLEGWGLTETCGAGARSLPRDPTSAGTVGIVSNNAEVKLVDVPSLGYSTEDKPNPRGELCVRGPSVFQEYYKEPGLTAQVKDADGWFHTGDVGEVDNQLRIKVIDRVKNVMKLSQGEYVAVEKVENGYATCPVIAQLFVYGQSSQSYLVGLLVPEPPAFAKLATQVLGKQVTEENTDEMKAASTDDRVKKEVANLMDAATKESGLQGFEKVKKFEIILEPFSTDNGMMTPTFKLRRKEIESHYKDSLSALYHDN